MDGLSFSSKKYVEFQGCLFHGLFQLLPNLLLIRKHKRNISTRSRIEGSHGKSHKSGLMIDKLSDLKVKSKTTMHASLTVQTAIICKLNTVIKTVLTFI